MADITTSQINSTLRCVSTALISLPDSYLDSASTGINTVIQTLTAYEAIIQTRLSTLNLYLLPLLAQKAALENVINTYTNSINIFSQAIINQCPALGSANQMAQEAIQPKIAIAKRTLNIINVTARLQLEYGEYRNYILASIGLLKGIKQQIDNIRQARSGLILTATVNPGSIIQ